MEQWPPVYDASYHPQPDSPYWFAEIETMDPEQREQTIILPKLQQQLKYAYAHSGLYRKKWDAAGVKPEDIRSLDDFEAIPILTKDDLRADQAEHPPFGSNLCVSYNEMARVHGTSGTTGNPTAFGVSKGDIQRIAETHARVMWAMGVRPDDIVFIGSFFSLYWGSWGAMLGTERLGATAFPFGAGVPGQSERAIEWMANVKPTVFYGTPSYSLYIAEKARAMGYDPAKDFNFRILFFSGEPGAGVPSTRKRIEETYGAVCLDSGSTGEMAPWMTDGECSHRQGMHLWQDVVYAELVDPETKKRVPYGEEGVTVYTHLERNSQPMIRFWAGDLSRWVIDPCPCGRTYRMIKGGVIGRADDITKVKGVLLAPTAIEEVVRGIPELIDEYEVTVSKRGDTDDISLKVELQPEAEGRKDQVLDILNYRLRVKTNLRYNISFHAYGSLPRYDVKAKRFKDLRKIH